jgi:hypothetical protein
MSDEMDIFLELLHKQQQRNAAIRRKNELEAIMLQREAERKYSDLFECLRYREAERQKAALEERHILRQMITPQLNAHY